MPLAASALRQEHDRLHWCGNALSDKSKGMLSCAP